MCHEAGTFHQVQFLAVKLIVHTVSTQTVVFVRKLLKLWLESKQAAMRKREPIVASISVPVDVESFDGHRTLTLFKD